ncbi:hypothetical protein Aduo_007631 [Ancylostoma duodenale]
MELIADAHVTKPPDHDDEREPASFAVPLATATTSPSPMAATNRCVLSSKPLFQYSTRHTHGQRGHITRSLLLLVGTAKQPRGRAIWPPTAPPPLSARSPGGDYLPRRIARRRRPARPGR